MLKVYLYDITVIRVLCLTFFGLCQLISIGREAIYRYTFGERDYEHHDGRYQWNGERAHDRTDDVITRATNSGYLSSVMATSMSGKAIGEKAMAADELRYHAHVDALRQLVERRMGELTAITLLWHSCLIEMNEIILQ
jgi:hypothetical protein